MKYIQLEKDTRKFYIVRRTGQLDNYLGKKQGKLCLVPDPLDAIRFVNPEDAQQSINTFLEENRLELLDVVEVEVELRFPTVRYA